MKKRNKGLITTVLILVPIICIIGVLIGIIFDTAEFAVYFILALVLFAIISKICMTLISIYKSHVDK